MKHFLYVLLMLTIAAAGAAAQEAARNGAPKKAAPARGRSAATPAIAVPEGAEKLGEGKWRARDAQGRTWIYRRTPFGIVRFEEEAAAEKESAAPNYIRVREAGESRIVFERRTPFGLSTWTKSPQELDEDERRALEAWRGSAKK